MGLQEKGRVSEVGVGVDLLVVPRFLDHIAFSSFDRSFIFSLAFHGIVDESSLHRVVECNLVIKSAYGCLNSKFGEPVSASLMVERLPFAG